MHRRIVLSLAGLAWGSSLPALLAQEQPALRYVCLYPGGVAEQGETVCLDVDGQRQLARCEMVLNNTSWHFLGTGCGTTKPPAKSEP